MIATDFFARDACLVAQELLGKIIRRRIGEHWLSARIIETEAYYLHDKGSHASLGFTEKRKALFMPPGTIYMYYARGRDSLNVSCAGEGNAVLIKSGFPYFDEMSPDSTLRLMQQHYPLTKDEELRPVEKLCNGQTLLCQALNIKVREWDQKPFDADALFIEDVGIEVVDIVQTTRLGIPLGRDEDLPYRFVDKGFVTVVTRNPLGRSGNRCL